MFKDSTVEEADEESDEDVFEDALQETDQLNAKVDELMSRPAEFVEVSCSASSSDTVRENLVSSSNVSFNLNFSLKMNSTRYKEMLSLHSFFCLRTGLLEKLMKRVMKTFSRMHLRKNGGWMQRWMS